MNNRCIWKFPLRMSNIQDVEMPLGSEVVCVSTQFETPTIWVVVDPSAPRVKRRFGILATGASFDGASVRFLGSFMLQGGIFVGHVVEPNPRVEIPL